MQIALPQRREPFADVPQHTLPSSQRAGISLVETIVSTMLVGILMTTSLQTVGMSLRQQMTSTQNVVAAALANGLMSEIVTQSYMEPSVSASAIIRESGESGSSRTAYDDVDDYHGWIETPPETREDIALATYAGWQRTVSVVWVNANDVSLTSGTETRVKKITVTVSFNGTVMATRVAIRTNPP
jgi:type II secretory pathway pseudopilin PulG